MRRTPFDRLKSTFAGTREVLPGLAGYLVTAVALLGQGLVAGSPPFA